MRRSIPGVGTILGLALVAAGLTGCVDRRFVIESAPPGAMVYVNDKPVGIAPVDVPFTYYGKYQFSYSADGYERLTVVETVKSPWWSYFPLDFVVENVLPFTLRDIRFIQKPLEPTRVIDAGSIKQRADELRARGLTIGVPLVHSGPPVPLPGTLQPPGATVVPPQGTAAAAPSSPLVPGTTIAPSATVTGGAGSPLLPGTSIAPPTGSSTSPLLPGTTIAPQPGASRPVPAYAPPPNAGSY